MEAMEAQGYLQRTVNDILVVLWGDPSAMASAVTYAAGFAKLCDATVTILCPLQLPLSRTVGLSTPEGVGVPPLGATDALRAEAEFILEDAKKTMAGYGVAAEGRVLLVEGSIGDTVNRMGRSGYDLIVVPESRSQGLARLFRKDAAVEIVKHGPCPVVVVKPPDQRSERSLGRLTT